MFSPLSEKSQWSPLKWLKVASESDAYDTRSNNQNVFSIGSAWIKSPLHENTMLVTGGVYSKRVLLVHYNSHTDQIEVERLSNELIKQRDYHQMVYHDGFFYALGGRSGSQNSVKIKECERLQITSSGSSSVS